MKGGLGFFDLGTGIYYLIILLRYNKFEVFSVDRFEFVLFIERMDKI
jgi:hypothetical protein